MIVLFFGDIVGRPGRRAVQALLPKLRKKYSPDLVLANGENLAGGAGITKKVYEEMRDAGIDYFTTGNHVWFNKEIFEFIDDPNTRILRPGNFPAGVPGKGMTEITVGKTTVALVDIIGQVFMDDGLDNPFLHMEKLLANIGSDIILVDFHAEATSEKNVMGLFLDGKVSAMLGTHTHVQTADNRILPNGTAYISDVGMCGPINSSIGIKYEPTLEHFLTGMPFVLDVASGPVVVSAVVVDIDGRKAKKIERIFDILKVDNE